MYYEVCSATAMIITCLLTPINFWAVQKKLSARKAWKEADFISPSDLESRYHRISNFESGTSLGIILSFAVSYVIASLLANHLLLLSLSSGYTVRIAVALTGFCLLACYVRSVFAQRTLLR
jgi:hypothetical protein